MPRAALPIDEVLPQIVAELGQCGQVVLRAPTGAGKTTRVPQAILDSGLAENGAIIVLQPRRVAARACARRIAWERNVRLGDEVGYHVRFDRCLSQKTRIQVMTEGILLRLLDDDPMLEAVAAVVFDEFHERSLQSDLALAMVRRVRETVRPDLKLVVMSATLDCAPIARWLGDCRSVESEGRSYPVDVRYLEDLTNRDLPQRAAGAAESMLDETPGDILVFLPGVFEIRQTAKLLEPLSKEHNLATLQLYGDLPPEQQDAVLGRIDRRKIVLATNVAETSLTIDGITGVVDTGLARTLTFDPHLGLDRLQLVNISQASADQRAGRAGRTAPGLCFRLWPERTHGQRPAMAEPEIRRLDLAGAVLELKAWGEHDLAAFPWFERPPQSALEQAEALLVRLEAVDGNGKVTVLGRAMSRLAVGPRLARMLLEGQRLGQSSAVALAAALLSERDPFLRGDGSKPYRGRHTTSSDSDVLDRLAALEAYEQSDDDRSPVGTLNRAAARNILRARDQLLRELRGERSDDDSQRQASPDEAVSRALLAGFPDRLARRSNPGSLSGRMVGGRGFRLAEASAVRNAMLFLAIDVDRGESEAIVRQASSVQRDWLNPERLQTRVEVEFDAVASRVIARRRVYWDDLLLEESPEALPNDDRPSQILATAAAERFDLLLPAADTAAGEYLQRLRWLANFMPDLDLPTLADDDLKAILPELCRGCRSFEDVRKAAWLAHLRGRLTTQQQYAIEREAPEHIEVPSGSRIKLIYEPGKPPVLAVRIQEIFGMLQTPRLAGGRVGVLFHLLAPNMRPEQVTDDLASFWKTTYHQVRKDLRRRYPKHSWPEDPYTAKAEHRPRRKK